MATNDITGDTIQTRMLSRTGRDNFDKIFNKQPMKTDIHEELKYAIADAHEDADRATDDARQTMEGAIDKRIGAAALVEKASRLHKHDVRGYLSDVMSGEQVKAYLSLHDAAKKRPALQDKRQLFLCGFLDQQEARNTTNSKPQPTFISGVSKFLVRINKEVGKRPVNEWSQAEKEQMQDVLKPIVELYGRLNTTPR